MRQLSPKKIAKYAIALVIVLHAILIGLVWIIRVDRLETSDLLALNSFNLVLDSENPSIIDQVNLAQFSNFPEIRDDYSEVVFNWHEPGTSFSFDVEAPEAGEYYLAIDYFSLNNEIMPIEIDLTLNGNSEQKWTNMRLRTYWQTLNKIPKYDIYGNQMQDVQTRFPLWRTEVLKDQQFTETNGLVFQLNQGTNDITLTLQQGKMFVGRFYVLAINEIPSYEEYHSQTQDQPAIASELMTFEAEQPLFKSSPKIRLTSIPSPSVSPYSFSNNLLNVVAEDFFDESGYSLSYSMEVPTSGLYELSIKYRVNAINKISYANIYIDNEIPFDELKNYPFPSTNEWVNHTLGANESAYKIFLSEGVHLLTIELTNEMTDHLYQETQRIIDEMGDLQLQIMRLTSGLTDIGRQWILTDFIPDVETRLSGWKNQLEDLGTYANEFTAVDPVRTNDLTRRIRSATYKLGLILEDYNLLPQRMNLFSEGSNSAVADLSVALTESYNQGISLDQIFIHGENDSLPNANQNFLVEYFSTIQKVILQDRSAETTESEKVIDVWVFRSRYYINVMQQFVDNYYQSDDGTKIRLSILPDEMKIVLANAANTQPDAVLGVSGWNPFELGLRGAVIPLEGLPGFSETIQEFAPGSLLHMMRDGHVYGLPETQDFYVTFYRKDILDALDLEVPETYQDIIEILPTLQAYGMNYYLPLSLSSGLKAINNTAPFIFQNGGDLFTEDAFGTAIDSPEALAGITQMIELFTTYGLPIQVPNFYDEFRSGTLPIGVGSFGDYLKFTFAAPEIANKWDIALAPGVKDEDGTVHRDYPGTAQSVAIFSKSSNEEQLQSWDFIRWWLSSATQRQFIFELQNTYGNEYVWNTANINAIDALPFLSRHTDVIKEQWESLHEIPKIPGGFSVERGISDVWNKAVLEGANIRSSLNDMVLIINREIRRKMIEFGYLDEEGNVLKPYILPTIEDVIALQQGGDPE